jgi:hypothetical protein
MAILLALLLSAFPSKSLTSWMSPESFHLTVGMTRAEAVTALKAWNPKPGNASNEIVVDYSGDKSLTLEFEHNRLVSIRFELFAFLPEIAPAFEEKRKQMLEEHGAPRRATKTILIYDNVLPNVMVVATADPKSETGKKGLGLLAVRYYDPR